ncbi:haloacid dehalogenase-like hydrolase domain-containing protein Sgpp [Rosa chinensis]|uniref:haloacid dehalogenase-like hydrolase domain-containing protein Sgpp n=1 Tax=Rosa chinensis TaxID=74649 RepID=UPI001AD8B190|nr:haloacid dehalogenase-like hydrolase domain-containing protein Sgpp [Rosa chinensis]
MPISSDPRPLDSYTPSTLGDNIDSKVEFGLEANLSEMKDQKITCYDIFAGLNHFPLCCGSKCSLAFVTPLEAILFDIDGTWCDSDPLHYYAFREMLQEVGFNGGVPITEEFFIENISGMHNEELYGVLFPDWDLQRARNFFEDKEDMFRRLASEQLEPMKGLHKLREWIENQGLKRAAVTNAPRPNGELLVSALDLLSFFEVLVIANECDRAKPFPDPYLKALQALNVSNKHAFVFEVWLP